MQGGWFSSGNIDGIDGKSLEFNWDGERLGVRVEGETDYEYVDLQGSQGPKGNKGDTGDAGAIGPAGPSDWGALPETNPEAFIHTAKQVFKGGNRAIRIEAVAPTIEFIDTSADHANWFIHVNAGRIHFLPDRNSNEAWETPWSWLDCVTNKAYFFGSEAWTAGNFNPNEYWRKDELLKFSKRYNPSANSSVNFLQVDFANASGVAVYAFEFLMWGGALNNYSDLYRYTCHVLIEDQNVQFYPTNMNEIISFSSTNNSITLTFDLWGNRNNLVVKGEQIWGFNWADHTVL